MIIVEEGLLMPPEEGLLPAVEEPTLRMLFVSVESSGGKPVEPLSRMVGRKLCDATIGIHQNTRKTSIVHWIRNLFQE